jgi:hypothetical protein
MRLRFAVLETGSIPCWASACVWKGVESVSLSHVDILSGPKVQSALSTLSGALDVLLVDVRNGLGFSTVASWTHLLRRTQPRHLLVFAATEGDGADQGRFLVNWLDGREHLHLKKTEVSLLESFGAPLIGRMVVSLFSQVIGTGSLEFPQPVTGFSRGSPYIPWSTSRYRGLGSPISRDSLAVIDWNLASFLGGPQFVLPGYPFALPAQAPRIRDVEYEGFGMLCHSVDAPSSFVVLSISDLLHLLGYPGSLLDEHPVDLQWGLLKTLLPASFSDHWLGWAQENLGSVEDPSTQTE